MNSSGQQFGGHPPSMRWKQIHTDTVRIIFPNGLEKVASDVANISHLLTQYTSNSIGNKVRKINIVLQNHTTVSNGYVGLGPNRSEFQLTPLQNSFNLGSIPWHQTLALHEYRHVQQYNNFRKGVSKGFYYLFGEQGQELANSTAIPNWFWEGDAVLQETMMSNQGRGRLPYFFNGYNALWSAGKKYSWMKLRNGSLRDYVPNHYQLGYMLVAYGREKFGEEFWKKITDDAVRFRGLFYPFQKAIKKQSGINFQTFRKNAFEYFSNISTPYPARNTAWITTGTRKHFVANEEFPQWVDSETIIYVRNNYNNVPSFQLRNISTGLEKKIRTRSISLDNYFSFRNGKIAYAAYEPDTRWGWRDYGILKIVDVVTGKERKLTHRSKYFSPDIDSSGQNMVAVSTTAEGTNELHLFKITDGSFKRISNPEKFYFTYPKFLNDKQVVTAVRDSTGNMMLVKINLEDGITTRLTPPAEAVIGFLQVNGDTILFTASDGYRDQLFSIIENKVHRIDVPGSHQFIGSYHAGIRNGKICWLDFTATGFELKVTDIQNVTFTPVIMDASSNIFPGYGLDVIERKKDFLTSLPYRTFPVADYRKSKSLFHIHSWRPVISDPEYSFSVISENILNTLQSEIFATYNRNEQSKQVGFIGTYSALFPWLRAGTSYTFDRQGRLSGEQVNWNEWEGNVGVVVPLNLSNGRNFRNLNLGTDLVYNKRYYSGKFKDTFNSRGFAYLNSFLNFTSQIQKARKQIYPRIAQTISLKYSDAISQLDGRQFLATADWYFPGIFITHNLVFNTAFHLRDTMQNIRFSNSFPFSRGYLAENFHRMIKVGVDYHFPLVYPDWGVASIIYFLRVRASAFYDYTNVFDYSNTGNIFRNDYRSFGAEVYFDTKWWNQLPVSFGIRYSRLLDGEKQRLGKNQWEFVLPVGLLD